MSKLVVEVRFHDGRYHGVGEDFPSPARLFQALVAGASTGAAPPAERASLEWLERQKPPTVALPSFRPGQALTMFVPHNDADAKDIADIRAKKVQQPWFFDVEVPFVYCWDVDAEDRALAEGVCRAAMGLYQLGRGIDQAYARAVVVDDEAADAFFGRYPGDVLVPRDGEAAKVVSVPQRGSLASLLKRFDETLRRIRHTEDGDLFVQASKARFDRVAYDGADRWLHFDLARTDDAGFVAWPLPRAYALVRILRQATRQRLDASFSAEEGARRLPMQGDPASPLTERLAFVPVPSRGMEHTNQSIRRVAVRVPPSMPSADAAWLLSALEVEGARLVPASETSMWERYARAATTWQTVTPAILTPRRRLEPTKRETKDAAERLAEEKEARQAVAQALRQAEVRGAAVQIDVQREPWEARGERAEAFAKDTRFAKERAWHVRITFARAVSGPLVIGDGRFAGLGVMAPVHAPPARRDDDGDGDDSDDVIVMEVDAGLAEEATSIGIAEAFRRAVMARAQEAIGDRSLPTWVTGHVASGGVARDQARLRLIADLTRKRLLALVPRADKGERISFRDEVIKAIETVRELKAGAGGRLLLRPASRERDDPLFRRARCWRTVNDYLVNRHDRGDELASLVHRDVLAECARRGLPRPHVDVLSTSVVKGVGVFAQLELLFAVEVPGPILLGRSRMLGGGLLIPTDAA